MSGATGYEAVVGLEVHCELSTATKLFCGCRNEFGAEPNTNVCPVCLGLPGSLPVLNERVVEYALRLGAALGFAVPRQSIFARKNYFYPDMPKDYQISQYAEPILVDGRLEVDGAVIGIERAHLEEDTGKTVHVGGGGRIHEADHSLVDYNRAGVPLMEIVSRPDLRSAEQARGYVQELRAVLQAIGVSDVKMEEGSLRVDANVSVRPAGTSELGTKVEIKNMNSLRSLGRAIGYEIDRQRGLLEVGDRVVQETRHWDEVSGTTHGMRSKEEAFDYRYFPEPDLVPVAPTDELRARSARAVPELPAARRARLVDAWEISHGDARLLVEVEGLAAYAEAAVGVGAAPKDVVNWVTGEVLGYLNESGLAVGALPLPPDGLAELVGLVADATLSRNLAKEVLGECLREPKRPRQVVEERGLAQVTDESELAAIVDEVLAANAEAVAELREGDDKVRKKKRGYLMGEAMKATRGKGNPQLLNRLLDERLGGVEVTTVGRDDGVERILVVTAHPDDVDFGVAGSVAVWTAAGIEVTYCVVTDGQAGGFDASVSREEMARIRRAEQRAAAAVVGVDDVVFLGHPDGYLQASLELRREIARVIRQVRPQRVVCQSPDRMWERIYASHPDHLAAGEATACAVYPDARNEFAFPELLEEGLDPWTVSELWLVPRTDANVSVDITDTLDKKLAALRCHQSQHVDADGTLEEMIRGWTGMNAERFGLPAGRLAEAFLRVDTR